VASVSIGTRATWLAALASSLTLTLVATTSGADTLISNPMKKNYYCIVLDGSKLLLKPIGGCYTENQALTRANTLMQAGIGHIIWTFSEDQLEAFKQSVQEVK
jgi:hypothetical protein